MSDGSLFLLLAAGLYVSECLVRAPREALVFLSYGFGRRWRSVRLLSSSGTERYGFTLATPLPPLGSVIVGQALPVSLTDEGFTAFTVGNPNPGGRVSRSLRFFRWKDSHEIGRKRAIVTVDGKAVFYCGSPAAAHELAKRLAALTRLEPEKRGESIRRFVAWQFRSGRFRRRLAIYRRATASLRFTCNLLVAGFFLGLPAAYMIIGTNWRFTVVVGFLWFLMIKASVETFCLHRRFYPNLGEERWQFLFLSLFVPQFTMRSLDELSKGLAGGLHPAAVGRVLKGEKAASEIDAVLRDAKFPLSTDEWAHDAPLTVEMAWGYHRDCLRPVLESAFSGEGTEPVSGESKFCPRCHVGYSDATVDCADCEGVPLVDGKNCQGDLRDQE